MLLWRQNEEILRKPDWLKIKLNTNENYTGLKKMMRKNLNTVCEEICPNIHECWGARRSDIYDFRCHVQELVVFAVKTGLPNELD